MKKMITICLIAVTVAACNNQAKHDAEILKAQQKVVDSIVKVEITKKHLNMLSLHWHKHQMK